MSIPLHHVLSAVTDRIVERSGETRGAYLERIDLAAKSGPGRGKLSCSNWAHAFTGSPAEDKMRVMDPNAPNIGIVTAYTDMLSAHQPFEDYPKLFRESPRIAERR